MQRSPGLAHPQLCVVGVQHDTSPVAIREKLSIPRRQMQETLATLRGYLPAGVILATCNRTEIYATHEDGAASEQTMRRFLKDWAGMSQDELAPYLYCLSGHAAMRHLSQTASGLCSMVVGEHEILGQTRRALEEAEQAGMVNVPLRKLFQHAIRTGRRVREETDISRNALSVSAAAVHLAAAVTSDISRRRVLLIGAGEAGKLVARALAQERVSRVTVASRDLGNARDLASVLGGDAVHLGHIQSEMEAADILITCTGAPHFVVHCDAVKAVMLSRPDRPMVIIDIAVPRDVEPEVGRIEGVLLYDIDKFNHISEVNRKSREKEIVKAIEVVDDELERFMLWWRTLEAKPTISALTQMADDIRQRELRVTLKKLPQLSQKDYDALDAMTRAIVNKVLHHPIKCLKQNDVRREDFVEAVQELFNLDGRSSS
ncbi:MAG: glutamyl-tRNA reductase [Chloroflexota bacterium]|nr:glutamyl-tRNA reductase [Chloroflexota bacterium]